MIRSPSPMRTLSENWYIEHYCTKQAILRKHSHLKYSHYFTFFSQLPHFLHALSDLSLISRLHNSFRSTPSTFGQSIARHTRMHMPSSLSRQTTSESGSGFIWTWAAHSALATRSRENFDPTDTKYRSTGSCLGDVVVESRDSGGGDERREG